MHLLSPKSLGSKPKGAGHDDRGFIEYQFHYFFPVHLWTTAHFLWVLILSRSVIFPGSFFRSFSMRICLVRLPFRELWSRTPKSLCSSVLKVLPLIFLFTPDLSKYNSSQKSYLKIELIVILNETVSKFWDFFLMRHKSHVSWMLVLFANKQICFFLGGGYLEREADVIPAFTKLLDRQTDKQWMEGYGPRAMWVD